MHDVELQSSLWRPFPFPPWDPVPDYLVDKIRPEDHFALHSARLEAVRTELEAMQKLVGVEMEIMAKYGLMK